MRRSGLSLAPCVKRFGKVADESENKLVHARGEERKFICDSIGAPFTPYAKTIKGAKPPRALPEGMCQV